PIVTTSASAGEGPPGTGGPRRSASPPNSAPPDSTRCVSPDRAGSALADRIEVLPREDGIVVPPVHPGPHRVIRHGLDQEPVREIVVRDHRQLLVQRL